MEVKERTDTLLHLSRGPSNGAWALVGGLMVLALGAAISYDNVLWKLMYVTAAIVIGLSYMEEYEDCIFDKSTGRVYFSQESLLQRFVVRFWSEQAKVVADLSEIEDVIVEEDAVGPATSSKAFHVVIKFTTYSISVSQAAVLGEPSSVEKTANHIRQFLGLSAVLTQPLSQNRPADLPLVDTDDVIFDADQSSGSSTEDGFEKVEKDDLLDSPADLLDTPPGFDDNQVTESARD